MLTDIKICKMIDEFNIMIINLK